MHQQQSSQHAVTNPSPNSSIVFAGSSTVPQAMPVTVPVTSSDLRLKTYHNLGSAGSSRPTSASSLSPNTPGSRSLKSPSSVGSMPPPAGTPTRLQTIRNQTLNLHLPGKELLLILLLSQLL